MEKMEKSRTAFIVGDVVLLNSGGCAKTISKVLPVTDDRGPILQLVWDGYQAPGFIEIPAACVKAFKAAEVRGCGVPGDGEE